MLSKKPQSVIERPTVARTLEARDDCPVRILCAPIGSGITTALREYVRTTKSATYLAVSAETDVAEIASLLADCRAAREIVVDRADAMSPEAFDHVLQLASSGKRRLLLAGNARTALRVHTLVARGDAILINAAVLAFTEDDILRLARNYGLDPDAHDVAQLAHDTEGWPIAVSWIVRDVARSGRTLRSAFDIWLHETGLLLREYIDAAIPEPRATAAFELVIAADAYAGLQPELGRLSALGYPVVRTRTGLRPYAVCRRIGREPLSPAHRESDRRLIINLFGRFSCRIEDKEVAFVRRRDRSVLIYLALSPEARVSRAELASMFWPGVPAAVSSQGVRTTLSRLRRAISVAVGGDAERYLTTGNMVALDSENVVIDARRFDDHLTYARVAEERSEYQKARKHYQFASSLYTGSLLRSEPVDETLKTLVEGYAMRAQTVSQRIDALRRAPAPVLDPPSAFANTFAAQLTSPV
jgi:hypothetical protein